jgi:hypothetical protein
MVHELNTSHWHRLTPDSSGNYVNGSWSTLASLPDNNGIPTSKGGPTNAPLYFASAVLGDGTVFVAGGENNTGKADADILTAQIYDPLSDAWTAIATPPGWTGIGDAPTCVLPDGRLLIGSFDSNANALFDPKTQIWSPQILKKDGRPDELMILWGATPAGSRASFYFPGTTAAEILAWAAKLYAVHNIKQVDAHTVQVPTGGVTFLPVPQGTAVNFAGLLSLSFPPTVHKGDQYDVTVRQITSEEFDPIVIEARTGGTPQQRPDGSFTWRRTMGTFQLTIPVGTKASLRESEERLFAILQYIQQSIPTESRWFQVFIRYLQQIAGRVNGLGGDPTQIPPSGVGQIPGKGIRPHREEFAGKIAGLIYDHFGDFLGFLLETADCDVRRFESREVRMERVVREAWEIRATVHVIVELHRPHVRLK